MAKGYKTIRGSGDLYTCGWIECTTKTFDLTDKSNKKEYENAKWRFILNDGSIEFDEATGRLTIYDNSKDNNRVIVRYRVMSYCYRMEGGYEHITYWFAHNGY